MSNINNLSKYILTKHNHFKLLVNLFLITQYVILIAFIAKEYKFLITFFSGYKTVNIKTCIKQAIMFYYFKYISEVEEIGRSRSM